ncbi:acyl-CoA dehydrogenase family protein [Natrinema halophilum]|uniref:acyl-CoA dehydrogenase family protein n=1 Tax=Natrinema halophilum TaxID=1699371 RepID=UPI001F34FD76|nr:acyl-CoA dehydrogenase family protein [Natrinema halophilum]UHQ96295.1 acyl-CoA/acyl-ACP dehydrogenase [Natrinema halophilum]
MSTGNKFVNNPSKLLEEDRFQELDELAQNEFRSRSKEYNDNHEIPVKNLDELGERGWLKAAVSEENGGWGSNTDLGDPAEYLQAIRTVARGCSSTAHCLQLHYHIAWFIDAIGDDDLIERYLEPMLDGTYYGTFVAVEPNMTNQYELDTTATPVDGGYEMSGTKLYATNGSIADFHLVFASMEGMEGRDSVTVFVVEDDWDGVEVDTSWWQPFGMRAAVSPRIELNDVFIPEENMLGEPGQYASEHWQAKYHTAFCANYLGSMEGVFDFFLEYMHDRGKADYESVQLRTGEVHFEMKAAEAFFHDAIRKWQDPSISQDDAEAVAMKAKWFNAKTAMDVGLQIAETAGSTAQFEQFPIGRYLRDMHTHTQHSGHDMTATQIGRSQFGRDFDTTREV